MPIETDRTITSGMSVNLHKSLKDRLFCDVQLKSGSFEIHAHRVVLATLSDYFNLLFKYEGGPKNTLINFDDNIVPGVCLESIVNFAYTGKINITETNVLNLLLSADYFSIPFIKRKCELFLFNRRNHLDCYNLALLTLVVCHLNLSDLLVPLRDLISKHFIELYHQQVLLSFSPHCLSTIIDSKHLTIMDHGIPVDDVEIELLLIIADYISKNNLHEKSITELLSKIDFEVIEPVTLASIIDLHPIIQQNEDICRIFLLRALPFYSEDNNKLVCRKYSQAWQYVTKCKTEVDIGDRITKIKTFHKQLQFITPVSNFSAIKTLPLIVGIELTYRSGQISKIGNTSQNPVSPNNKIVCTEFTLAKNEVVIEVHFVLLPMKKLTYIEFKTNFGNTFSPRIISVFRKTIMKPDKIPGYLHAFELNCHIDKLKPVWMEFRDPHLKMDYKSDDYVAYCRLCTDSL